MASRAELSRHMEQLNPTRGKKKFRDSSSLAKFLVLRSEFKPPNPVQAQTRPRG